MKKIFVFTFIATLALGALQLSGAEAPKDAKEANKLAREGAEASKNQEWDKAIELLRKPPISVKKTQVSYSEVIKLKPNEVRYVNYRAYIYELKKDLKNSMADTDKVLKLDPNNPEAKARKSRLSALETANAPFTPIPAPSRKPSPTPHHKP